MWHWLLKLKQKYPSITSPRTCINPKPLLWPLFSPCLESPEDLSKQCRACFPLSLRKREGFQRGPGKKTGWLGRWTQDAYGQQRLFVRNSFSRMLWFLRLLSLVWEMGRIPRQKPNQVRARWGCSREINPRPGFCRKRQRHFGLSRQALHWQQLLPKDRKQSWKMHLLLTYKRLDFQSHISRDACRLQESEQNRSEQFSFPVKIPEKSLRLIYRWSWYCLKESMQNIMKLMKTWMV